MMDIEILIVGENTMLGPKSFKKICLRNHFHEQREVIQKIFSWNECPPPKAQLLSTTLNMLTLWKIGCFENK
jgi:hypothetical protein